MCEPSSTGSTKLVHFDFWVWLTKVLGWCLYGTMAFMVLGGLLFFFYPPSLDGGTEEIEAAVDVRHALMQCDGAWNLCASHAEATHQFLLSRRLNRADVVALLGKPDPTQVFASGMSYRLVNNLGPAAPVALEISFDTAGNIAKVWIVQR